MERIGMQWLLEARHPDYGYPVEVWETTAATRTAG
jgi:hypothetical protein